MTDDLPDDSDPALLPDAVLRYAEHDDGLFDVHLPPEGRDGVVVLLHGGFWKTAYDRRHTRPMARALAAAGLVVVTPEYRRVGPGGAGGWPTTADDVRRAVERVPELLAEIGVDDVDGLRVVGHSAGGHLALWLSTQGTPGSGIGVDRTVALAPVGDLREALRRGLGSDAARAFLGDLDHEQTLRQADPMVLLDARPAGTVHLVHGTRDDVVPVDLSRGLVSRHPWIELTELPVGHFELIDPSHSAFATVVEALGPSAAPRH